MSKFRPGESGNPKGRKPGATNKVARPIKEQLSDFLNQKIQELPEIWSKLSPHDRVNLIKDLMPYFVARLQSVELSGEINFKSLPEDQLDQIADKLYNKKSDE